VVSSTPRSHFTPGKDPVPILQEAGWAPGLVWTGGKSRPHRDSIPDGPARSQSLHRLNYPAHHVWGSILHIILVLKEIIPHSIAFPLLKLQNYLTMFSVYSPCICCHSHNLSDLCYRSGYSVCGPFTKRVYLMQIFESYHKLIEPLCGNGKV